MPFDYANAKPDLKALSRIGFALIASAVLCFGVTLTLVARTKPPQTGTRTAQKRCACGNRCVKEPAR